MSKKEKSSFNDKFKQMFGRRETTPINYEGIKRETHVLSSDDLKDLCSNNNLNHRLKSLKELYEIVLTKRLEKYAVEAICYNIKDLLDLQSSSETRQIVLQFYSALICGQMDQLDIVRSYLYRMIVNHNVEEDLCSRFDVLKALTDNGKFISYFEEEIGAFLLYWFPSILSTVKAAEFLNLVTNVIKYNAAYIDDDIILGFVQNILTHSAETKNEDDIQECLNILDALLLYSHLPQTVLKTFICTLCLTVNIERFSQCSWKQMRNLLGTNVGHSCVYILCFILQEKSQPAKLVRGAVFFIGMSLWGTNSVSSLRHPPDAILPSFLKVLDARSSIIAYETILCLQRLVGQQSDELRSISWNIIFNILLKVLEYPQLQTKTPQMSSLGKAVHEFITLVEEKCPEIYADNLYRIIETCTDTRSEQSVIRLILHISESISPFKPNFISSINKLLDSYFKNEKRHSIQLKVLERIHEIREKNLYIWEDDVMDQTIFQNMVHADSIADVNVRKAVVSLLIEIAESCTSSWFVEVISIIEKIMKRMFEDLKDESISSGSEVDGKPYSDVTAAVEGLIRVFKKQLFMVPSNHCSEIFTVFINHITMHYEKLSYVDEVIRIRKLILEFLLHIRSNRKKQIGVLENESVEFSVYVLCDSGSESNIKTKTEQKDAAPLSPAPSSPSLTQSIFYLNYEQAYLAIITSLKEEKDWGILEMVLTELPNFLKNKSLVVRGNCSISSLCSTLCVMVNDRNYGFPDSLKNTPPKLSRTDIHTLIFPIVSALTSYHGKMEPHMQRLLIKCLQTGLVSRSAKICMEGLTLCTLEMQNSMVKLLPDVLLKLSKISATVTVAVSVLEFLSYLIRLPNLYISFVEDQYMSIFAIALPYTNPFKFNQYIVALSHHVIAMWFLKCRIPFRKDFAKFITKGLRSNLSVPREDSSRSDSHRSSGDQSSGLSEMSTEAIIALHTELMETGLDLMARFTFGMAANVPKRSPVAEFLLENGQKSSWLIGNKIVTVTTSGCGTKSFKRGLCERCYTSCREICKNLESDDSGSSYTEQDVMPRPQRPKKEEFQSQRKRHRSAIQRSTTLTEAALPSVNQAKDDILLHYQKAQDPSLLERHSASFFPSNINIFGDSSTEESADNKDKEEKGHHLCSCWCATWAEIHIRRPTGTTSWMMKNQNHLILPSPHPDIPLSVLSSLVLPQKEELEQDIEVPSSETESESSTVAESDFKESACDGAIDITAKKPVPPMRRTNSSPDMNTGWSNFESYKQEKEDTVFEDSVDSVEEKFQRTRISESAERSPSKKDKSNTRRNLKLNLKSETKAQISSSERRLQFAKENIHSAPIEFPHKEGQQQANSSGSFRDRGHTISVMSPSRPNGSGNAVTQPDVSRRSGMNPSFVFLQLFHESFFGGTDHKPLHLLQTEANNRALSVLDHIPPYDTHKIGVVYVGPGQAEDEVAILSNVYGSSRYVSFIEGLGDLVMLTDTDPHTTYLGGLDTRGEDGQFTYVWHDDVMQVVFHIATFMLNKESDKNRNEKKKHIANDCVMIAYNESGKDFNLSTIRGHVTNACVVVTPEDFNSNVVTIKHKTKDLVDIFGHTESYIVSDARLPVFVRQMALHANLASLIISRRQQSVKYTHVSNWLERLRTIKRLRAKVLDEIKNNADNLGFETFDAGDFDDFTDYV